MKIYAHFLMRKCDIIFLIADKMNILKYDNKNELKNNIKMGWKMNKLKAKLK